MAASTAKPEFLEIAVGKIDPDPHNPRKRIEVDDEFVQSISEHGILEPIVVVPGEKDGRFTIAFGERRYTGARKASLKTVPCIVRHDLDEVSRYEQQVIENIHREGLEPLEEAAAYVRLVTELGVPQRELVKKVGRSQSHLSKYMSLVTRLPVAGQELLNSGGISVSDAVVLASLHDLPDLVADVVDAYKKGDAGYYGGPDTLARAARQAKQLRARQAAKKKLDAAGVTIVDSRPSWRSSVGVGSSAFGVELDPAVHAGEPCHRAYVDTDGDVLYFCADTDRHKPDGEPTLKAPNLAPAPPLEDDASFADDVEWAAGGMPPDRIEGQEPADWMREREERIAREDAEREARQVVIDARRAFIRQMFDVGVAPDLAFSFVAEVFVTASAEDYDNDAGADIGLAMELLGLEVPDGAEDEEWDFGPWVEPAGKVVLEHAALNPHSAALAAAVSAGESKLGPHSSWTNRGFANGVVRRHYAFLTGQGYTPADVEAELLAAGDAYRRVNGPHEFVSTGENTVDGVCDICGTAPDFDDRHTNTEDVLAAERAALGGDDPVFTAYLDTGNKLAEAKASKTKKGITTLVDVFDDARTALLERIVAALTVDGADPRPNLEGIAPDADKDQLGRLLDDADIGYVADVIELTPKPSTNTKGMVIALHLDEILDGVNRTLGATANDFEFAAVIPGYFEFSDDEAVERIASWVDDHNLSASDLLRLQAVENANAEAIDRPYLRAAIEKLIAQSAGEPEVEPAEVA